MKKRFQICIICKKPGILAIEHSLSAQGNFFILNGVAIAMAATGRASGGGGGGRKYNNAMHAFSMEEKKDLLHFM